MKLQRIAVVFALICAMTQVASAAVPEQITVQGKVTDASDNPLPPGPHTFTFRVFDAFSGGTQVWPAGGVGDVQIISTYGPGLWVGSLGDNTPLADVVFADTLRWLEIDVDGTTLPRVLLMSAPTALRVATVDGASGGRISGKLTIGPGQTNTGSFAFVTGTDNQATGNYSAVGGGALNKATGESSVIAGGQQNDATGFASAVGGGASNDATNAHSVVSGGLYNTASAVTSTVAGGQLNTSSAASAAVGGGESNQATGNHSVVSGGLQSTASGGIAAVGGGSLNEAQGDASTVAGGELNRATWFYSSIGGGTANTASNTYSAISGGFNNISSGVGATVGGGGYNRARGQFSTVAGGGGQNIYDSNAALGMWSSVGGGSENIAGEWAATVSGGFVNLAMDSVATIGGGVANAATGIASTIAGGSSNAAYGAYSTVAGGLYNYAIDTCGTVGGGGYNKVYGPWSTIAGGGGNLAEDSNSIFGWWGTIGGGRRNIVSEGFMGTVAGGINNNAGHFASIGGGGHNTAWSGSTIAGGEQNEAGGFLSTVGGGRDNRTTGDYATVPGGTECHAAGEYSFAAGAFARAHHRGAFVWNDGTFWLPGVDSAGSTAPGQFIIRATGGVGIGTTEPNQALHVMGNILASGCVSASNVICPSDERLKSHIREIPNALAKVAELRGVTYEWRLEDFPKRDFEEGEQVGVIAQEVQKVLPQAVKEEKDGYLAVDYARLVPLLIEGMKEQQRQIDMQQDQIDQLKRKLEQ